MKTNFNDPKFIEKLKQRDNSSLSLIIDHYSIQLYRFCLKHKLSESEIEDCIQNTWSTFIESVKKFEGRSHIRTYIFGILLNKMKEHWRQNKKHLHQPLEEESQQVFNSDIQTYLSPEKIVYNDQVGKILLESIDKLPSQQKTAFILKELQGESTEEICNMMNITRTHLGVIIFRAKNTLRRMVEQYNLNRMQ